jgi:pyrroline-5-carboxylate reductase
LFYIVEAFITAARREGFSYEEAFKLITQTLKGSAEILVNLGLKPEVLRAKVTSKGGTTEAAIKVFDKQNLKKIIYDAVDEAAKRSKQLSC